MIRILLFIFLVILFHQTKGQDKIEDLFQRAEEHFEKEELDSALLLYHFISENFKEHPSVPEAIYNKAYIFNRIDEKEKAKKIFIQFLKSDFSEKHSGPGEGIMSEPFSLFKHRAANHLAEIYLDEKRFRRALKYTKLAEFKYPYIHFCGNEIEANEIYFAVLYSRCYDGLGKKDKAISLLWDHIFYYGLASNTIAVEQIATLLKDQFSKMELEMEIIGAIQKIEITSDNSQIAEATIEIFGEKIELPDYPPLWRENFEMMKQLKYGSKEWFEYVYKSSLFYEIILK